MSEIIVPTQKRIKKTRLVLNQKHAEKVRTNNFMETFARPSKRRLSYTQSFDQKVRHYSVSEKKNLARKQSRIFGGVTETLQYLGEVCGGSFLILGAFPNTTEYTRRYCLVGEGIAFSKTDVGATVIDNWAKHFVPCQDLGMETGQSESNEEVDARDAPEDIGMETGQSESNEEVDARDAPEESIKKRPEKKHKANKKKECSN